MSDKDLSEKIPIEETSEDRLEREARNNFHILFQIEQRLQDIANAVEANTVNIEILEEAMSSLTTIPTRSLGISYKHRESKLWVNNRFFIKFDGKEADVLALMFYKTTGLPKTTKLQCSEVAEKLSDKASNKKMTQKAVYLTVKRIESKLNSRLGTKNLLTVTTKEFYFSSP